MQIVNTLQCLDYLGKEKVLEQITDALTLLASLAKEKWEMFLKEACRMSCHKLLSILVSNPPKYVGSRFYRQCILLCAQKNNLRSIKLLTTFLRGKYNYDTEDKQLYTSLETDLSYIFAVKNKYHPIIEYLQEHYQISEKYRQLAKKDNL